MSSKMLMILIIWILTGNATGFDLPVSLPGAWWLDRQAQPEPGGACVVLAVDDSGSMQANDPRLLRYTGARLFLSLLEPGDRAGAVRFSSRAEALFPGLLAAGTGVEKRAWFEALAPAAPQGYTDLLAALQQASDLLAGERCELKAIVVLSDGQPELPGGLPAGYEDQALQVVQHSGAPLWGIALTRAGESPLLFRLAEVSGGQVIAAESAGDLLDAYLAVFAGIKDRTVLGGGRFSAPGESGFLLEAGLGPHVQRLTLAAAHDPGVQISLRHSAGGLQADEAGSFALSTAEFEVFSAARPTPGQWTVRAEGDGSAWVRVILRSRLRLSVDNLPRLHPVGSPLLLEVRLVEEDDQGRLIPWIGDTAFSARITLPDGSEQGIDRFYDDGTGGDRAANDGMFTTVYGGAAQVGLYTIRFTGYKGPIAVQGQVQLHAVEFPRLEITAPAPGPLEVRGAAAVKARLTSGDPSGLQLAGLVGRITPAAGGPGLDFSLHPAPDGTFEAAFTPITDGPALLEVFTQGAVYRGQAFTSAAQQALEVRRVPSIRLRQGDALVLRREVIELAQGTTADLVLDSSSWQDAALEVEAAGLPAGLVLDSHPRTVPPGQSLLRLVLRGAAAAGEVKAVLYFHGQDGVEITPRSLPLVLQIEQPALAVQPPLPPPTPQDPGQPLALHLVVESHSTRTETLSISYEGPGPSGGREFSLQIPAGGQQTAALEISTSGLAPGPYRALLRLTAREGVQVTPGEIAVQFTIAPDPWWQALASWQNAVRGGIILLLFAGLGGLRRARPRPWGWLHLTRAPYGRPQQGVYSLAGMARGLLTPRVLVGSGGGDTLRLAGGLVLPGHAALRAARVQTIIRTGGRNPRPVTQRRLAIVVENLAGGRVAVDGAPLPRGGRSAPLRSGSKITVGDYEFLYREISA